MEVLLASLLSTDVNQKLAACERLQQKLKESNVRNLRAIDNTA